MPLQSAVAAALLAGLSSLPAQALQTADMPLRIELFASYSETAGSGIGFSNPAGELAAAAIDFGLVAPWWPLGDARPFGARLSSGLQAPGAGTYTLTLGGDDATYLFIDGSLVLSQPGDHPYTVSQVTLALDAGVHSLELQFYNGPCCGSALTLDPGGLAYVPSPNAVPEPRSAALWLAGLGLVGWALQRRAAPAR